MLNLHNDREYMNLTNEEIIQRFQRIEEIYEQEQSREVNTEKLKSMERTRYIKLWHDHSSILNHTYINFMVFFLYNKANFLNDMEYSAKFPERWDTSVQSIVEKPQLYKFGQSGINI